MYPDQDFQHTLDGFTVAADKQEVKVTQNGVSRTEYRPFKMSTSIYLDAIPSVFMSNYS
jgi:hypothetical protein